MINENVTVWQLTQYPPKHHVTSQYSVRCSVYSPYFVHKNTNHQALWYDILYVSRGHNANDFHSLPKGLKGGPGLGRIIYEPGIPGSPGPPGNRGAPGHGGPSGPPGRAGPNLSLCLNMLTVIIRCAINCLPR